MKSKIIILLEIAIVVLLFTNCRKDITVPNSEITKIFGKWEWVDSQGGLSGNLISNPSTVGYNLTIEFEKNGIYKEYKDGKQNEKFKYTITQGSSIYSSETAYIINYQKASILSKKKINLSHSIIFRGQDTLILNDEAYDGSGHTYVRK